MKKFYYLLAGIAMLLVTIVACESSTEVEELLAIQEIEVSARSEKVDLCHYDADTDTYFIINVSENAYDKHIAHGDKDVYSPGGNNIFIKVIDRGAAGIIEGEYIVEISADDINGDFTGTGIRYDIPNGGNAYVNITGNVDENGVMTFLMEQWINDDTKTGTPQNWWNIEGTVDECSGISEIHWVSGKEGVHVFTLSE